MSEKLSHQSNTVQTEAGVMYLDAQDSLKLGQYGYYEPEETALIKQLVKPDWTCLDIGAHIGYFTLLMAQRCKFVIAFEAEPYNYFVLKRNLILNHLYQKVTVFNVAVTNQKGSIPFFLCIGNSGMHRIYSSKWCMEKPMHIESIRLDDFTDTKFDFIKMDIEGAELGALKGMKNLLTNSKPIILMEFCPQYIEEYGANPEEEYDFLKALGYDIRLLPDKDTSISFADLERETRKEPTGRNILCIPK